MSDPRLAVLAGDGVVQRSGDVVIVVLEPGRDPALTERLLATAASERRSDLFRALGRIAMESPGAPPFGVIAGPTDEPAVFLHGDIGFTATVEGHETAGRGTDAAPWLERTLPGAPARIGVGGEIGEPPRAPWGDLREGVVPGAGAWLLLASAPAESSAAIHVSFGAPEEALADRAPLPRPDDSLPAEEPAEPEDEEGPSERVIVKGVRCPVDHHNSPAASYCSSCGRKLGISRSIVLVDGPRPPLGVILVDDGATIPLKVDLVLGRDPAGDDLVLAGEALGVEIPDPEQSVSRSHLHVRLEEWDVLVADRGSSNGSFVWDERDRDWRRLAVGERLRVEGGTRLLLGRRELVFDRHHVR